MVWAGTFQVRVNASNPNLMIGYNTTVQILGWANDPVAVGVNGLNGWELSAEIPSIENNRIAVATDGSGDPVIQYIAPENYYIGTCSSWNTPVTGDIEGMAVLTFGPVDSTTGVGGYSLLAEFTVVGVSRGTATYTVGGDLFDGWLRDSTLLPGVFDAAGSNPTLHVYFPGDANDDGATGLSDLSILASNYGIEGTATWSMGDFTGDHNVNLQDLSILASYYGQSAGGISLSPPIEVPEPGTVVVLMVFCLWPARNVRLT